MHTVRDTASLLVVDVGDATGHSSGEVASRPSQEHRPPTSHVLTAVVTTALQGTRDQAIRSQASSLCRHGPRTGRCLRGKQGLVAFLCPPAPSRKKKME